MQYFCKSTKYYITKRFNTVFVYRFLLPMMSKDLKQKSHHSLQKFQKMMQAMIKYPIQIKTFYIKPQKIRKENKRMIHLKKNHIQALKRNVVRMMIHWKDTVLQRQEISSHIKIQYYQMI